jgi:phosphotriesterase-related protein
MTGIQPGLTAQVRAAGAGRVPVGRVITVTGPVDPDSVGVALMHEHLASNMLLPAVPTGYRGTGALPPLFVRHFQESGRYFRVPRTAQQLAFWDRPNLSPDMRDHLAEGWLTKSMFVLNDEAATTDELAAFRAEGGGTIVDVTPIGIGRDPAQLRRLAETSGARVVMATGWYRWMFHPPDVARRSIDELADQMVREIEQGVSGTGVRAGIIGEIPVDGAGLRLRAPLSYIYPDSVILELRQSTQRRIRSGRAKAEEVYDREELKVLRAAARASRRTGVTITLHAPDPWLGYLDVLESEHVDFRRVVVGHSDLVLLSDSLARAAFARGVYLQVDYQLQTYATGDVGPFDQLLDRVVWAVRQGFGDRVLLSLDLCFRQGLSKYGGGGYRTLFRRIIPALRARGLTEAEIRQIVVDSPRRVLATVPVR